MLLSRSLLTSAVAVAALFLSGCDMLAPQSNPPTAGGGLCTNTCPYAGDGECDDGGAGSLYDLCGLGTDCTDCGTRSGSTPGPNPGATTGTLMVYTEVGDAGYIDVSIGSLSGRLTHHYTGTGALTCPTYDSGLTIVGDLAPGSYSLSAVSQNGRQWSGSYSVSAGACRGVRLVAAGSARRPGDLAPGGSPESSVGPLPPKALVLSRSKAHSLLRPASAEIDVAQLLRPPCLPATA